MHEIVRARSRPLSTSSSGVEAFDLRVAVMCEMKGAEPVWRKNENQAGQPRNRIVQPARTECRPVHRLVQGGEEEHQDDAVRHQRNWQQKAAAAPCDGQPGQKEQAGMAREMLQARGVGWRGKCLGGFVSGHPSDMDRLEEGRHRRLLTASDMVGCAWQVRARSSAEPPNSISTATSWIISPAPKPTMWTPSTRSVLACRRGSSRSRRCAAWRAPGHWR